MVALAYTVAFEGVSASSVEVQCAVTPGLPARKSARSAFVHVHRFAVKADHDKPLACKPA
jgi:hypothetical protein